MTHNQSQISAKKPTEMKREMEINGNVDDLMFTEKVYFILYVLVSLVLSR